MVPHGPHGYRETWGWGYLHRLLYAYQTYYGCHFGLDQDFRLPHWRYLASVRGMTAR